MKYIITAFVFIIACSISYMYGGERGIPVGGYKVEWDAYDPNLHGKTVIFNEPMAYAISGNQEPYYDINKKIKRSLFKAKRQQDTSYSEYHFEPISVNETFQIVASYWIRDSWIDFTSDYRSVVLLDSYGNTSRMSFYLFNSSNHPDLAETSNW